MVIGNIDGNQLMVINGNWCFLFSPSTQMPGVRFVSWVARDWETGVTFPWSITGGTCWAALVFDLQIDAIPRLFCVKIGRLPLNCFNYSFILFRRNKSKRCLYSFFPIRSDTCVHWSNMKKHCTKGFHAPHTLMMFQCCQFSSNHTFEW